MISVISNTALVLMKLIVGLLIGSVSVISEAIHSGFDLLAAVIALFSVRTSSRPADSDHPFGHGKIENVSGAIEALLIFLAAGWIIFEAVKKFLYPEPMKAANWGVGVMFISAVVNIFVARMLFKAIKEAGPDREKIRTWLASNAYEGMATTVAAVLVDGDVANLAHVGDSRIYLWSDGEIELLTRDHSWVNEQIENGAISPEQARSHPLRNVVTRALGGRADLVVDIQSRRMAAGDMLLLCSDGLTTMIPDDDIARILAEAEGDVTKAANALVGAANERGGEDNITVVLLKFGE